MARKLPKPKTLRLPPKGKKPRVPPPLFNLVTPMGGEVFEVGSKIPIVWTGGPPGVEFVRLALIDVTLWETVLELGITPYLSTTPFAKYRATIPANFCATLCHQYQIYIEDVPRTTWTYGPALFSLT